MSEVRQHTITALVQNESGTINRLASLFRRRGFSLASFNAGDCEEAGLSRVTLVLNANSGDLAQCLKQLDKLIDVVEVENLEQEKSIERELAIIRVDPDDVDRTRVYNVVNEFMAKTPRSTPRSIFVEFTADTTDIERLVAALSPFRIGEIVRTGLVAMKVPDGA